MSNRGGFKIIHSDFEVDRGDMPNWLKQFADTIDKNGKPKTSVEVARSREQELDMIDQISSIVGGKSRHATVEDAIKYYQERTGLISYLRQAKVNVNEMSAKASDEPPPEGNPEKDIASPREGDGPGLETKEQLPKLFEENPEVKFFIDNIVKTRHGNIHIPAIQQDILDIYKTKGVSTEDVDDPALMKYINDIITQEQGKDSETDSHRIGEGVGLDSTDQINDTSNSDAFGFATPAKM